MMTPSLNPWTENIYHTTLKMLNPNPNQLYEDMQKLDDMYEELMWHPQDKLQFTHDGERIIITNTTLENKK